MKMKYVVNIRFEPFKFKDGSTAISFAELAKAASVNDAPVGIELEMEPEVDDTTVVDDISEAFDFDEYLKEE